MNSAIFDYLAHSESEFLSQSTFSRSVFLDSFWNSFIQWLFKYLIANVLGFSLKGLAVTTNSAARRGTVVRKVLFHRATKLKFWHGKLDAIKKNCENISPLAWCKNSFLAFDFWPVFCCFSTFLKIWKDFRSLFPAKSTNKADGTRFYFVF